MKDLSPEICRQIGQARRANGISQSALAAELGCKQPALSMFEAGDGTKLSDDAVKRLAARFGISLDPPKDSEGKAFSSVSVGTAASSNGFCPNCHCPSNVPYVIEGKLLLHPLRNLASPVALSRRCAVCGEVLEVRCPECGAPLNEGACCVACGIPYVTPALPTGTDIYAWTMQRRKEIKELMTLTNQTQGVEQ